ncbi:acetate/propionate family kinase [Granulicella cerasi]|uniref:Acetate kinase n=1 Tax=Granulicella cerasi TaxID=741063 RepID=A0ABW1Z4P5_9BACT
MSETGGILVLNSGSSSLKFGVYAADASEKVLLSGSAEGIGHASGSLHIRDGEGQTLVERESVLESQEDALKTLDKALREHLHAAPVAVGHRIVHGGPKLREHQRITHDVLEELERAVHFAPLHIPTALKLVKQSQKIFLDVPQFACFDTVFHRTMPEVAARLPVPDELYEKGVMRYGFHGISYESVVHRLEPSVPARCIIAHLGSGSSLVAVREESIDTTMGLTPTGGIPMATRSGDLDPGVLIYLLRAEGRNADELEELLNRKSGLIALSSGESDMQELMKKAQAGDEHALLAMNAFVIAVRKQIGAYAALMGGLDLLVFTGGIGEHAEAIRQQICEGLEFLGVEPASDKVKVLETQEELQIARHCVELLKT